MKKKKRLFYFYHFYHHRTDKMYKLCGGEKIYSKEDIFNMLSMCSEDKAGFSEKYFNQLNSSNEIFRIINSQPYYWNAASSVCRLSYVQRIIFYQFGLLDLNHMQV